MLKLNKIEESEFSESAFEKEYKSMDLNTNDMKIKVSSIIQMSNHLNNIKENLDEDNDEARPLTYSYSLDFSQINNDSDNN